MRGIPIRLRARPTASVAAVCAASQYRWANSAEGVGRNCRLLAGFLHLVASSRVTNTSHELAHPVADPRDSETENYVRRVAAPESRDAFARLVRVVMEEV